MSGGYPVVGSWNVQVNSKEVTGMVKYLGLVTVLLEIAYAKQIFK
jgi:hypothetical protein